ncbi:hypothetical protein L1987_10338 [Smallanthus sonchifolius]|uniref:Uncharacterized protein n=1 Tax=Smallanthus sonchifolius TaxID=185202 RepID=A0ACB9JRT2_9ASTR|nr:hypothetical protein L1987_10338 [Smallanthus sonchifolius]
MDLEDEDWVNVHYDGLLEVHDDRDEKFFSRTYVKSPIKCYERDYFNARKTPQYFIEDESIFEKQLDHKEGVKEIIKLPILIKQSKETSFESDPDHDPEQESNSNQDPIFHVFFRKENQFVEMKMGSPRLSSQESDLSHIETAPFQHDEKCGDHVVNCSSPSKMIKKAVTWKESNQRLKFWKWGLSGIGVFCSVGMTAATICIIICGNGTRHKQQNQKLRIQIYPDKRINQVVQKANEAMSSMRGLPLVKAQITYGGHYERF